MKNLGRHFTGKKVYYVVLHVAVVVFAIQVVLLSMQNRDLKENKPRSKMSQLQMGDTLSLGRLVAVQEGTQMDTVSQRRLIFIMTTHCPFCRETLPLWSELAAKCSPSMSVLAISLDSKDSTLDYIRHNNIKFPVFVSADVDSFKKANRTHSVPLTLVIGVGSKTEKLWIGKLSRENVQDILSFTLAEGRGHVQPKGARLN